MFARRKAPLAPAMAAALALALLITRRSPAAAAAEQERPPGPPSTAAAEALFQEGRALLMAGKAAEACPKLEESNRLDPATGTLLALALCREQQGALATAWAAFVDLEGRARRDGRADRERIAREHAAALRPRLSTLTLDVPAAAAETPGLAVAIDGVALGRGAWSAAIPVDGGAHLVAATAPGRPSWQASVTVKGERDHARVRVDMPGLGAVAAAPPAAPPPAPPRAAPPVDTGPRAPAVPVAEIPRDASTSADDTGAPPPGRARRTLGIVLAAVGAIVLGTGVYLGLDAKHDYDRAVADCPDRTCHDPAAFSQAQDARSQGNFATVLSAVGGVAIASGAVVWILAPRASAAGTTLSIAGRF